MTETGITSWHELLNRTVELGLGAALLTRESAQRLADELLKKGEMSREEGKKLVSDMLKKGKDQKQRMEEFVTGIVEHALEKMEVARRAQIEQLEKRVAALEKRLDRPGRRFGRSI
ncbi:MAG: hypothetical protein GTN69_08550 [Armatimonadetes bacterium]|nr:hypothetical protein [Gemmatimonadales bacterium]NIO75913.1 hypothetical protein [Armatimonadota bacterium]